MKFSKVKPKPKQVRVSAGFDVKEARENVCALIDDNLKMVDDKTYKRPGKKRGPSKLWGYDKDDTFVFAKWGNKTVPLTDAGDISVVCDSDSKADIKKALKELKKYIQDGNADKGLKKVYKEFPTVKKGNR